MSIAAATNGKRHRLVPPPSPADGALGELLEISKGRSIRPLTACSG